MKKLIALLLCLVMVFALASVGSPLALAADKPVKLIAYCPDAGAPFQTVEKFAEIVNAADCGVEVEVHENGTLGNDAEAIESTRMGTIDVICADTSGFTAFYEPAKVLDLPFLFSDAEQACDIMNGPVGEEIFEGFSELGLVYLGEGDKGLRQISDTHQRIHTADDVEDLWIHVPRIGFASDMWEALGAIPILMSLPEFAIALSNGSGFAQDGAPYQLVADATYDNVKYFSNINYMWMGTTIAMNAKSWDKLSAKQQEVVKAAGYEAGRYGFELIKEANLEGETTLREAGVKFDTEPDIQSFKDKLDIPAYYDRYEEEIWFNRDLLNAILEATG